MTNRPDIVRLRVGDEHPVRLRGLGTAGYRWAPEANSSAGVAEVTSAGTELPGTDAIGASGTELFRIRALQPGTTYVRFAQRRPWEPPDQPPAAEHVIELEVEEH